MASEVTAVFFKKGTTMFVTRIFLCLVLCVSTFAHAEMASLKKAEPYQTEADLPSNIPVFSVFPLAKNKPVASNKDKKKSKHNKRRHKPGLKSARVSSA
jgi:hypothetical protein